jgi:toxin FitB
MADYLLDTNLLIAQPDLARLPETDTAPRFFTSAICYAELLEGEYSERPTTVANAVIQSAAAYQKLGDGLPFGQNEVNSYRALCAAIAASGRSITKARRVDTMIAATAHANNMTLATRNIADFEPLKDVIKIIQL